MCLALMLFTLIPMVSHSSWESPGNNTDTATSDPAQCHLGSRCGDYQLATMLHEMDPFGHATTYEEENVTLTNHFDLPAWTFASVRTQINRSFHCLPLIVQSIDKETSSSKQVEALGEGDPRLCGGAFRGPGYPNSTCHGGSTKNHHDVSLQGHFLRPVFFSVSVPSPAPFALCLSFSVSRCLSV